jgi:hypothetical protein
MTVSVHHFRVTYSGAVACAAHKNLIDALAARQQPRQGRSRRAG